MRARDGSRLPAPLWGAVFVCCLMAALLVAAVAATFVPGYTRTLADRVMDRAVQVRTRSAAIELVRSLHADWRQLEHLAGAIAPLPEAAARALLVAAVEGGERVVGAGLAGLDGQLALAAGTLREGTDARDAPWFAAGLRGRFAGALAAPGPDGAAAPHLHFALPAQSADGRVAGVVALQLSLATIERFLQEAAAVREIDLFLVNAVGEVVFATAALPPEALRMGLFRAAAAGAPLATHETWPDGRNYFAAVVPTVAYGDLPGLGWRLVGRMPGDAYEQDRRSLLETLLLLVAAAIGAFVLAAMLFGLVFVRPLTRLVESAERMAEGEAVYPPETRTSAEGARLSAALVRLQARLALPGGAPSAAGGGGEPPDQTQ